MPFIFQQPMKLAKIFEIDHSEVYTP